MKRSNLFLALACAGLALAPTDSRASDGVYEINLAVVEAGSLPGDSPGYPLTITRPGSYLLTGNLDMLVLAGTSVPPNAIEITASDVTLDLGGFMIKCRLAVIGAETLCTNLGQNQDGIRFWAGRNVEIRNGTIKGMGDDGIDAANSNSDGLIVRDIRSTSNGDAGITVYGHSQIIDSMFDRNLGYGVYNQIGPTSIRGVSARFNGIGLRVGTGIQMGDSYFADGVEGPWGSILAYSCSYIDAGQLLLPICPN